MNGGTCGGDCRGGSNDGQACVLPAECQARRELGHEPTVTIDAGLAAMPRIV